MFYVAEHSVTFLVACKLDARHSQACQGNREGDLVPAMAPLPELGEPSAADLRRPGVCEVSQVPLTFGEAAVAVVEALLEVSARLVQNTVICEAQHVHATCLFDSRRAHRVLWRGPYGAGCHKTIMQKGPDESGIRQS